jgi:UrcA family protein
LSTSTSFADVDLRTEAVEFQDLNVNTSAGAQVLYGRIRAAANRVCASNLSGDRFARLGGAKCAREAAARAVEHLDLPALTAYYNMMTHTRPATLVAKR